MVLFTWSLLKRSRRKNGNSFNMYTHSNTLNCNSVIDLLGKNFAKLMSKKNEDFPEKYDRYIWIVVFFIANFFGALAFGIWDKIIQERKRKEELVKKLSESKSKNKRKNLNKSSHLTG